MSKYTVELRHLLNSDEWASRIDEAMKDFVFPQDDENFTNRNRLVENIKGYYYFREIGFETPEQFVMRYKNYFKILWYGKYYNVINEEIEVLRIDLNSLTREEKEYIFGRTQNTTGTNAQNREDRNIYNENPEKNFNINSEFATQTYATTTNLSKLIDSDNYETELEEGGSNQIITTARHNFDKLKYLKEITTAIDNTELKLIEDLSVLFMQIY